MKNQHSFGIVSKARRLELGLTQEELARRVGCAPITIRKIEADDLRPSVQIAERMAMALNIPLEERAAFVKLARIERVIEEPAITPMPRPEEIGSEDLSGRAIRGYALGERLGSGGMGAVYRAIQPLVEREVAIKIILPVYANHPDFIRRFEAEAQLVARLEHPHIVPLYDYWREPGVAYLIMRLLRGGNLQSLLRNGTSLPTETILRMMEQISSALSASHRAGVVHRDLKPSNVLLDEDNNAYLADFGIAKNLSSSSSETRGDMVLGSPDYISPEQIRSEFVRPQTDIYALGVMLYELLTGKVPFQGKTPFDVMTKHLYTPLPPLEEHRSGLPEALNEVIKHATAKDPLLRYENVELLMNDLRAALQIRISLSEKKSQVMILPLTELDNPYKGLRAFAEGDAHDFYGREALVQQLLIKLGEDGDLSRFLTVVGPSGSGKSSLVKAGLIPALRRGALPGSENWFIVEMIPGPHPLEELEAALLRIAVNPPASLIEQLQKDNRGLIHAVQRSLPDDPTIELVLIIDQFEEVFTLVQDEAERMRFLGVLVSAVLDETSRVRVILTMRADFIDRPLGYIDFGELIHQRMEIVLPLTSDELESTIALPAERVGLQLDAGLLAAILRDLGDQPGTLPLLQYALTELYEKRSGNLLTKSAYQEIGGVLGALGRRAEEIFIGLDSEGQSIAKQLFLRMVTLGEGVEDTRRRVLISELENMRFGDMEQAKASKALKSALDAFGRARLLSFDRDPGTRGPTVEVAHEAILREWSRLRGWLEETRLLVRMQRQLSLTASEWLSAQRDDSFLLGGTKLAQYEGWMASEAIALTQQEIEFLKASLDARDQREQEEAKRQSRELETLRKLAETESTSVIRLRGRNRVISMVGAIALVLAILAGMFAIRSNQNAQQVEQESRFSTSRELAAASLSNLDVDPERSILLALQGLSVQYTSEAENALRRSLVISRVKWTITTDAETTSVALSPDGKQLAAGDVNGLIQIWDMQTGQKTIRFNPTSVIEGMSYTSDGSQLFAADSTGYINIWNVKTGKSNTAFLAHQGGINIMVFSADKKHMATTSFSAIKIWDVETRKELFALSGSANISSVVFSKDGSLLATASVDGNVIIWNANTGEDLFTFPIGANGCYFTIIFNQDASKLISSDSCGSVRFWDITSNKGQELLHRNIRAAGGFISLSLSNDGSQLAVSDNNSISIWDAATGFDVFVLPNDWQALSTDFSQDGKYFAAGGLSTTIKVWDMTTPSEKLNLNISAGKRIADVTFNLNGSQLVTASIATGGVQLWDSTTGQKLQSILDPDICCSVKLDSSGTRIILGSINGDAQIRDAKAGNLINQLSGDKSIVSRAMFNRDGTRIATANQNGTARIWDANSGKLLISIDVRPNGMVNDIAFSADGKLLATSSTDSDAGDGQIIIWDAASGKSLFTLGDDPHPTGVWGLAISPDGTKLAVGYSDNTAKVWDIASRKNQTQPKLVLPGHTNIVWKVAFSPDGTRLATAGFDGLIKLWNISPGPEQGREITTLTGHTAEVSGIAFSSDGKYLASVSWDGTLRVYYTQIDDLIAAAKKRLTRSLTIEECHIYLHRDACPPAP